MSDFRVGTEWVGGRDDDSHRQESKVKHRYMKRRRRENESDVVLGERVTFPETISEGSDLRNELRVSQRLAVGCIDEESGGAACGSGSEEGETIFGDGKRLTDWRERNRRTKATVRSRLVTESGVWIY